MTKILDLIHEAVVNKHRARNEAIKRILTRHKTGVINQSAANQQLKSCGHPGLNMKEDYDVKSDGNQTHVFHDESKIGTITKSIGVSKLTHKEPDSYSGVHHPTGKKFNTGSYSHAMTTLHKLHSSHNRFNESVEDDPHHGFKPDQIIKRKYYGELKDARYLGPHHNKEYAKIISHNGKKITDKWENLVGEEWTPFLADKFKEHSIAKTIAHHKAGRLSKDIAIKHLSSQGLDEKEARARLEECIVSETLPANATSSDFVDDFVRSKNKMFDGDSKKQRIRRALGAYYAKHKK
jgi:hypothetical protein